MKTDSNSIYKNDPKYRIRLGGDHSQITIFSPSIQLLDGSNTCGRKPLLTPYILHFV
jgi:hypothetical protein